MIGKIEKYKNEYVAIIPKIIKKQLGIKVGDKVNVSYMSPDQSEPKVKLRILISKI